MTVTTPTSKLSLAVTGEGARDTALLLHGGPGVPDYLADAAGLFPQGYRTVRFDQRGTGSSVAIDGSFQIEEYVTDIDAVLQALGVERVHLFGHSWGGLLAQIYAGYRPDRVRSLFLVSPSSGTGKVWEEMEREVMAYNRRQASGAEFLALGLYSLLGMMGSDWGYQQMFRRVWSYYFRDPRRAPPADAQWLEGIKAPAIRGTRRAVLELDDPGWEARLSEVNVPVLVVYGAYDIYGDSRQHTFRRLPLAERVELEDAGHLPWIQRRRAFVDLLHGFYHD